MKILQEKYPLIDFPIRQKALTDAVFKKSLLEKIYTSEYKEDERYEKVYEQFIEDIALLREIKTYFITTTISEYLFDNSERLMKKMFPFLTDLSADTGALLWRDWTYFYRKFPDGDTMVILYLIVQGDTSEIGAFLKTKGEEEVRGNFMKSVASQVAFALSILMLPFLEFAECETKIINGGSYKKTILNKEKYITNITSNIEIVDSNWFTTLVHSGAFNVSGHFRLQPYGVGMSQRKMIWIKEFEKHGYIKKSRIEINDK